MKIKDISISVSAALITFNNSVYAADMSKLDQGGWRIVHLLQQMIFWLSMIYTLRALLEVTVKGEGSWKRVGQGFAICAGAYLVPMVFEVIRDSFQ